jgi:hypothetical protein
MKRRAKKKSMRIRREKKRRTSNKPKILAMNR